MPNSVKSPASPTVEKNDGWAATVMETTRLSMVDGNFSKNSVQDVYDYYCGACATAQGYELNNKAQAGAECFEGLIDYARAHGGGVFAEKVVQAQAGLQQVALSTGKPPKLPQIDFLHD